VTSITYDAIRDVLDKTSSEVSDSDLDPEKSVAEGIVTDELEPYAELPDDQDALDDTAAYLAAALYTQEGTVGQLSQGSQQVSFTDGNLSYLRIAEMRDPTGRLQTVGMDNTSRYTGSATPNSD